MRRLFEICTCMALALTATSCVRDEVVVVPALPSPSDVIAFGANLPDEATRSAEGGKTLDFSEFEISSEDGSYSLPMAIKVEEGISKLPAADTRGAVVDSAEELTSLKAWARLYGTGMTPELYIPGTAFEKNTTTGIFFPTGGESYLWPGEGKSLDFVTVSPANIDGFEPIFDAADATRVTSFHYTVPADVANQPDILVATTSKSGNFGESVPLDFKHIMAAVNFKVGTINSTVDCTIQSITMKGVYDHGTYQITTGKWVDREVEGTNFSVPLPSGGLAITGSSTTGQPINNASTQAFMMIPQQPTTGAEIEIKLIAHNMGNKEYTLHASVQGHVWARNTTTNYLINIDGEYGLQIVAEDQLIDSHYVITKVRVSSEYPFWTLTAEASDDVKVTVQNEAEVNTLAKKGYWTDYEVTKEGDEYIPTAISARGDKTESGVAGESQVVYVFIPENVSGEDRSITLTLTGIDTNGNTSTKTLPMVQHSVKWLDPTGEGNEDLYWGCELLIEGGQVGWGFCWDDARAEWRVLGKGNENNQPGGWVTKIRDAMEAAGLNVSDLEVEGSAIRVLKDKEHKSRWLIYIDYGLLGRIDVAHDPWLGDKNTEDLYLFQGVNAVNSILDFINSASNEVGHVDGTYNPSAEMTLDYAAMYAMKRNRFYYYEKNVDGTMMYTPVIDVSKDLNWYLPAKDQFPILMQSNWGQQFTFNDLYWTSTAYLEDETNNSLSYAYINGVETIAHRNDSYLTMALRRKTYTADVVVKPEDVIVPGGGDNGPEYGEGGNSGGNTGGDIEGNT